MKILIEVPIEIAVARSVSTGETTVVDVDTSQIDCALKFLKELQCLASKVKEE